MTCSPFHRSLPHADASPGSHAKRCPDAKMTLLARVARSASELRGTQTHSHPASPVKDSIVLVSVAPGQTKHSQWKSLRQPRATPNVTLLCRPIFSKSTRHHQSLGAKGKQSVSNEHLIIARQTVPPACEWDAEGLDEKPQHLSGLGVREWTETKVLLSGQTSFYRQDSGCRKDKICQLKYSHGSKLVKVFCLGENLLLKFHLAELGKHISGRNLWPILIFSRAQMITANRKQSVELSQQQEIVRLTFTNVRFADGSSREEKLEQDHPLFLLAEAAALVNQPFTFSDVTQGCFFFFYIYLQSMERN